MQTTSTSRLEVGDPAPRFVGAAPAGDRVALSAFAGRKVWLALMRYAACPFCNWRVHHLIGSQEQIARAGVTLVAVFPSPAKRCVDYIERYQPAFPIIADPDEEIFGLYCSETSWLGELKTALKVVKSVKAVVQHPANPLAIDGPVHRMPAEFFINEEQRVARVLYGDTLDAGFSVDDALQWAAA